MRRIYQPGGPTSYQIRIVVTGWTKLDPECTTSWDANMVNLQIMVALNSEFYLDNLCPGPIAPCQYDSYYTFIEYMCWQKRLESNGQITYHPCSGSSYCTSVWKWCYDPTQIPPYSKILYHGPEISGTYSCSKVEESTIPDPTEIGIESACFRLSTLCDQ